MALFPGLPGWADTRKVKPIWILLKQETSEWQWHQLGHMQVCTSLQTHNHASTLPLSFYRPDALPAAQPTASKHWRQSTHTRTYIYNLYWLYSLSQARKHQSSLRQTCLHFTSFGACSLRMHLLKSAILPPAQGRQRMGTLGTCPGPPDFFSFWGAPNWLWWNKFFKTNYLITFAKNNCKGNPVKILSSEGPRSAGGCPGPQCR